MTTSPPLLHASGLTKRFGNTTALDSLDLTLETGEPVALIGPNGAGKTTLLSLLCGYLKPSDGSISVLGAQPGSPNLHGKLAALPQDALLDPRFSIGKQLAFFCSFAGVSVGKLELKLLVS